MATTLQLNAIAQHGNNLLAIFPRATERDPVSLCKKLRRIEVIANTLATSYCNGEIDYEQYESRAEKLLIRANKLLGNFIDRQPKTGAKCGCRRGLERDNCPACEGTGYAIDFAQARRNLRPMVPTFINGDPRGYALKIDDEYIQKHRLTIHRDMGGYGILAPEIDKQGN